MVAKRKRGQGTLNDTDDDGILSPETFDKVKLDAIANTNSIIKTDSVRVLTGSLDSVLGGYDFFVSPFRVQQVYHEAAHIMAITAIGRIGRYLATGSKDEKIWLWDLKRRITLGEIFEHQADITWLGFRGRYLISCDSQGIIMITRTRDWEPVARMKAKARINHFSLHPSGKIAISVGADKCVRLWNMMTGRKASANRLRKEGLVVEWSPSGIGYAIMYDQGISFYGMDAIEQFAIKPTSRLTCMTYGYFKTKIALFVGSQDGHVRVYEDDKELYDFHSGKSRIKAISFYGQYLVSAASDGTLQLYDMNRGVLVGDHKTTDRLTSVLVVPSDLEEDRNGLNSPVIGHDDDRPKTADVQKHS